jgi:hypothetical protein
VKIFFPLSPVKPTIVKFGINYYEGEKKNRDEEKSVVTVVVMFFFLLEERN